MSIVVFLTFSAHFGLIVKDNGAVSLGLELVGNGKTTRTSTSPRNRPRRPQWERKLPKEFRSGSTKPKECLKIKIGLSLAGGKLERTTYALVDSRASGLFISKEYVKNHGLATRKLVSPIPLHNSHYP